jgi:hypothetical protein
MDDLHSSSCGVAARLKARIVPRLAFFAFLAYTRTRVSAERELES